MKSKWKGKLIIIIGPSGSGKSTLISHLKKVFPDFVYPVTSTTRKMRPGEKEGISYNFLSHQKFEEQIKDKNFLEWAEYGGNLYGTPKDEIITAVEAGRTVLREVEVQGARSIKKIFPKDNLSIIYIDGGPWDLLKERIMKRTPIGEKEMEKRHQRFNDEKTFMKEVAYVVQNYDGKLKEACLEIENVIREIVNKS